MCRAVPSMHVVPPDQVRALSNGSEMQRNKRPRTQYSLDGLLQGPSEGVYIQESFPVGSNRGGLICCGTEIFHVHRSPIIPSNTKWSRSRYYGRNGVVADLEDQSDGDNIVI